MACSSFGRLFHRTDKPEQWDMVDTINVSLPAITPAPLRPPPSLPVEIFGQISRHLDTEELYCMLLVSRSIKDEAEPSLYHAVSFDADQLARLLRFTQRVIRSPDKAALVHELSVSIFLAQRLNSCLRALPALRVLSFRYWPAHDLDGAGDYFDTGIFRDFVFRLRTFCTDDALLSIPSLAHFLDSQDEITELEVLGVPGLHVHAGSIVQDHPNLLPNLRTACLDNWRWLSIITSRQLTSLSLDLRLDWGGDSESLSESLGVAFAQFTTSLRELSLHLARWRDVVSILQHILMDNADAVHLQAMMLTWHYRPSDHKHDTAFYVSLPGFPFLHSLLLDHSPSRDWLDLNDRGPDVERCLTACPSLQRIAVPSDYSDWYLYQRRPHSDAEIDALRVPRINKRVWLERSSALRI